MRPYKRNFGNNVDVLILAMLEALAIFLLLAVYFHLTAPTLCCYSLVVVPLLCVPHMHGLDIVHLLQAGKQVRHHRVLENKGQTFEKMCAGTQTTNTSFGGRDQYWFSA